MTEVLLRQTTQVESLAPVVIKGLYVNHTFFYILTYGMKISLEGKVCRTLRRVSDTHYSLAVFIVN